MTQLSVDTPRAFQLGDMNDIGVAATAVIYEGSAVGDNGSGYARQLVAGDPFRGFSLARADNAAGGAGDKAVRVRNHGQVQLAIGSLAITDVGKPVYASDGAVFTLTASTNTPIGRVVRYVSSGIGIVAFDARHGALGLLTVLTAATGTASDTIADVGSSFSQTTLNNNFKSLADKLNAALAQLK